MNCGAREVMTCPPQLQDNIGRRTGQKIDLAKGIIALLFKHIQPCGSPAPRYFMACQESSKTVHYITSNNACFSIGRTS